MENDSIILSAKLDKSLNNLPNPSTVLKSKAATMAIFNKVARHPDIFPQISSYRSALCNVKLTVSGNNKSVVEFFDKYFDILKLRNIIPKAVSARDYGFSVLECTEYDAIGGYTVPTSIELCPHEYFFFDRERKLRLEMQGVKDGIDLFTEYPGKYILLQNGETLLNPYGVGLLDVAYWLAVGLNGNFEYLMQFVEDDGRDKWIGHYQAGATDDEINKLFDAMIRLRNNGVAAMPAGMDIEAKSMTGRASTNNLYKDTDEMLRRKVEKLWTGTDLTMQVDGKGGYSSSSNGLSIRTDALQEGISLAQAACEQLVDIICYLNNIAEKPVVTLQLPQELDKVVAETDQLYYNMGLRPTKELFLKRGYAEGDFFIADATTPTEDFAADPDELETLTDVFEAYRNRLKKKEEPQSRTKSSLAHLLKRF